MIETLYGQIENDIFNKAKEIKLLICDVDGVFSDGRIYLGNNGEELKAFHTRDGFGIKALLNANIDVAIITGRSSNIVQNRMENLGVKYIYQGIENKIDAFEDLCLKLNLKPKNIAYIGDDVVDIPVMNLVSLSVAVSDSHPLVLKSADYTTTLAGGFGAVRETCDLILQAKNLLNIAKGISV